MWRSGFCRLDVSTLLELCLAYPPGFIGLRCRILGLCISCADAKLWCLYACLYSADVVSEAEITPQCGWVGHLTLCFVTLPQPLSCDVSCFCQQISQKQLQLGHAPPSILPSKTKSSQLCSETQDPEYAGTQKAPHPEPAILLKGSWDLVRTRI